MCSSQTLLPASWRRAVITCSLSDLCSYRPLVLDEVKKIETWSFYWSRCRMCHCCSDPCFSCRVSGCSDEGEFIINPLNTITSRTRSGQLHVEFNVWAFCMKCFRAESIVWLKIDFLLLKFWIIWFQRLKCDHVVVSFLFCHSELNIFGLWTKQDLRTPSWKQLSIIFTIFFYFIHQTTYRLVKTITCSGLMVSCSLSSVRLTVSSCCCRGALDSRPLAACGGDIKPSGVADCGCVNRLMCDMWSWAGSCSCSTSFNPALEMSFDPG